MVNISTLLAFCLFPSGFTNADLRDQLGTPLGPDCRIRDLRSRRLRLQDLIERVPHSHRYRATDVGVRTAVPTVGSCSPPWPSSSDL